MDQQESRQQGDHPPSSEPPNPLELPIIPPQIPLAASTLFTMPSHGRPYRRSADILFSSSPFQPSTKTREQAGSFLAGAKQSSEPTLGAVDSKVESRIGHPVFTTSAIQRVAVGHSGWNSNRFKKDTEHVTGTATGPLTGPADGEATGAATGSTTGHASGSTTGPATGLAILKSNEDKRRSISVSEQQQPLERALRRFPSSGSVGSDMGSREETPPSSQEGTKSAFVYVPSLSHRTSIGKENLIPRTPVSSRIRLMPLSSSSSTKIRFNISHWGRPQREAADDDSESNGETKLTSDLSDLQQSRVIAVDNNEPLQAHLKSESPELPVQDLSVQDVSRSQCASPSQSRRRENDARDDGPIGSPMKRQRQSDYPIDSMSISPSMESSTSEVVEFNHQPRLPEGLKLVTRATMESASRPTRIDQASGKSNALVTTTYTRDDEDGKISAGDESRPEQNHRQSGPSSPLPQPHSSLVPRHSQASSGSHTSVVISSPSPSHSPNIPQFKVPQVPVSARSPVQYKNPSFSSECDPNQQQAQSSVSQSWNDQQQKLLAENGGRGHGISKSHPSVDSAGITAIASSNIHQGQQSVKVERQAITNNNPIEKALPRASDVGPTVHALAPLPKPRLPVLAPDLVNNAGSAITTQSLGDSLSRMRFKMSDRVYTRIGYIAKGGSSKVYKVMAANSRVFALKCVSLQKADQATIEGYINEVRLLCKLQDNPWIIRLWDYELSNSALNLLMEYGETDLAKLLYQQQNRPFSINFIRHYWVQMLEAVQTIHNEKIVHTDLKPANFVLVEGSLKLIDFGIANMIANDTTNIQREGHVGTANYMAPEAITSNPGSDVRKIGRASDVWSLGCILYQMVYGGTPFSDILHLFQKLSAIADPNWKIPFPELTLSPLNQSQDQDQQQPQQPPLQSLQLQQQQQRLQQQLRQAQQQRLQQPLPASGAEGMAGIAQELKTHQVGQDLIRVMKGCLQRDPKNRMTIPELLQDPLLQPTQRARHSSSLLANGSHSHGPDSDSDEVQLDMRLLTRIMQATIDFGKETCRTSNGGGQGETGSTSTLTSSGNPGWPDIRPDQLQAAARDLMDQMQIMLVRRRRAEAKSLDQDNESGIGGSIPDDSSEMIDSLRIRL